MTRRNRPQTDPTTLTVADLAHLAQVTHEIRTEERHGGQCGWVAEVLTNEHGWDMHGGIYHSTDARPIGDHVWNVHTPTGTIIDATGDQFGEGDEVRILSPDHPTYARYRWAESDEQEEEWLNRARRLRDTEGDYWWVPGGPESPAVAAYLARVARYEAG